MSRMSELAIEIQDMLMAGMEPSFIAKQLKIPLDWVLAEDDAIFNDPYQYADDMADLDAQEYGDK